MPTRLPTLSDFTSGLNLTITPPPASQKPVNILILLHGLGDSNIPFTTLAKQFALPETACIAVQAPSPLPFDLGGFHWGDDINFESSSGHMEFDTGFTKAMKILKEEVILQALVQNCGYSPRNIILFGFGQGGMAATATAATFSEELGGVVSIGGPPSVSLAPGQKSKTPVLILGGSSNSLVTKSAVARMKTTFSAMEYHKWRKEGDSMPANRDEMLPIMKFFARRLKSRAGVPEGSMEIG